MTVLYPCGANENRTRVSTVTVWKDNHYPIAPKDEPTDIAHYLQLFVSVHFIFTPVITYRAPTGQVGGRLLQSHL